MKIIVAPDANPTDIPKDTGNELIDKIRDGLSHFNWLEVTCDRCPNRIWFAEELIEFAIIINATVICPGCNVARVLKTN